MRGDHGDFVYESAKVALSPVSYLISIVFLMHRVVYVH